MSWHIKRRRLWEVVVRGKDASSTDTYVVVSSTPARATAIALSCGPYHYITRKPRRVVAPADPRRWPTIVITKKKKEPQDLLGLP